MPKSSEELRKKLAGIFAFPVTPFTDRNEIDVQRFRTHLEFQLSAHPSAVCLCGSTGEFFSLDLREYRHLLREGVEVIAGKVPALAGVGYGTKLAIEFAQAAEQAGVDGILVMPPYLVQADQAGLLDHYREVASATRLGVVVYQRDNAIFSPQTVLQLAEIPNVVGFKDGYGDKERLVRIRLAVGDRLAFINGMPTAEMSAPAFFGVGVRNYSSAVFNFVPEIARAFYEAMKSADEAAVTRLMQAFYQPFAELRDRKKGYAIALIKAGLRVLGRSAGRVRPPLVDPSPEEETELNSIIQRARSLVVAGAA